MALDDAQRVDELQELHKRLVRKNGQVMILGDGPRGRPNFSKEFAVRLEELTPSRRSLAIAQACAQPWREDPDGMPECYRQDLAYASYHAAEESRVYGIPPYDPKYLFERNLEPISPSFLRQLADLSPTGRAAAIAFTLSVCWKGDISEEVRTALQERGRDWGPPEEYPDWVKHEYLYRAAQQAEELRQLSPPAKEDAPDAKAGEGQ